VVVAGYAMWMEVFDHNNGETFGAVARPRWKEVISDEEHMNIIDKEGLDNREMQ